MIKEESKRNWVIAGLLLGILMSSMNNTIVATAMGTIIAELGGLDKFIWVTSAYMIASVAGMPVFGKLSDMYGRKYFYILGLSLFMIGSALCGTAQNIVQLSIYRAIQGLGGGSLMPIAFTIVFDIFPVEQRGKISGLFGAVFGLSSIFGPLIGAYFTDYISWRWNFYINIPLGLISLVFLYKFYFESLDHKGQKIDWWGTVLLVASIVSLMFALEFGGRLYAWGSAQIAGFFASFIVLFAIFLWVETKAPDPIVSLSLFKNRLFAASQGVALFYGSVFILTLMYIPIYVQGVFGGTATNAGLVLTPLMLGSVGGSQIGGRTARKTSYRNIMLGSGALLVTGIFMLSTLTTGTPRWLVTLYMVITGMGVGMSFPVLVMSSIHGLDIRQRGTANSAVAFFRIIGMTLGITIFGAIQSHQMLNELHQAAPQLDMLNKAGDARVLLQPGVRANIPPVILNKMAAVLTDSIAGMFQWSLISVASALFLILRMGNTRLGIPGRGKRAGQEG